MATVHLLPKSGAVVSVNFDVAYQQGERSNAADIEFPGAYGDYVAAWVQHDGEAQLLPLPQPVSGAAFALPVFKSGALIF